jgi:hypothetical protein
MVLILNMIYKPFEKRISKGIFSVYNFEKIIPRHCLLPTSFLDRVP